MASKKNQHFVPQFYLRRFSNTLKSPYINLFNYKSQKFISNAAIKKQASINNFYDNDNLVEDTLSLIEREAAKCISKIDETNVIPKSLSDRITILAFTLFQTTRTKSSALDVQSGINDLYKRANENVPALKDFFKEYRIGIEKPASFAISITARLIPLASDLKLMLILNNTNQDFITSDNPVLKYNQFLERRRVPGGITGVGVKGIQYFFPIDSKKCLLFYDGETYSIGNIFKKIIIIKSKREIDLINILQILNCEDNIYFNENTKCDYIKDIYEKSKKYEKPGVNKVEKYPLENSPKGYNGSLLHSYTTDLKIDLNLSFIKETRKAKKYKSDNKAVHPRNEEFNDQTTVPNL